MFHEGVRYEVRGMRWEIRVKVKVIVMVIQADRKVMTAAWRPWWGDSAA